MPTSDQTLSPTPTAANAAGTLPVAQPATTPRATPQTATSQAAASQAAAPARGVLCAACHEKNSADSRFCRLCGASLRVVPATNGQTPTAQASDADGKTAPLESAPESEKLSPAEIDGRRARQLLDRALVLADKGDRASAILACRQAISLAPQSAACYATLGPLLERSGDSANAIAAYENVLILSPNSPIERDSLARLRAAALQSTASRGNFHFDEGELFQTTSDAPDETVAPPAAQLLVVAPVPPNASSAASQTAAVSRSVAALQPAVAVTNATAHSANAPDASAPAAARPKLPVPMTVPPISATPVRAVAPSLLQHDAPAPSVPRWVRAIRGENSFWMQSAPLAATAFVGLGLLLWARGVAATRASTAPESIVVPAQDFNNRRQPQTPENSMQPNTDANTSPGDTVSNVRPRVTAPDAPAAPVNDVIAPRPTTPRTAARPRAPRVASLPPQSVRPAASRPRSAPPQAPAAPEESPFGGMAPARLSPPIAPAERVFTAPAAPGSSTGGVPLNPAGEGKRGYIRVTGRPSVPPTRPDVRSNRAEEAAREAAREGRGGNAINSATASIEGGRDAGWRFQQRALLFLEQGDNARAADDFRTAISSYRDQINRGINVEQARSGLDACQNGLRLAQLRLR